MLSVEAECQAKQARSLALVWCHLSWWMAGSGDDFLDDDLSFIGTTNGNHHQSCTVCLRAFWLSHPNPAFYYAYTYQARILAKDQIKIFILMKNTLFCFYFSILYLYYGVGVAESEERLLTKQDARFQATLT